MNILLTGATGFIGRALALRLRRDGHRVTAWVRSAERARAVLGAEVDLVEADLPSFAVHRAIRSADAVINLAGEPIVGGRWTARRRAALVDSRVNTTRAIVEAMRAADRRPGVLVSASAVGYYGARPGGPVDESAPAGDDFLAELCASWEAEAMRAASFGTRVVTPRIGVVLGRGGGALAKMLPPFRVGVGGRLGSGEQPMPWIHIDDLVEVFARAVTDDDMRGPINAVAPNPVDNATFTRTLGEVLGRPTMLPVPSFALRAAFGAAATVLLDGQRAVSKALSDAGFSFQFPHLQHALADILADGDAAIDVVDRALLPASDYLRARRPRYELTARTVIRAPIDDVFAFFSKSENLGAITPPDMKFSIQTDTPVDMRPGTRIDYRIGLGPIPMRWTTEIERWEPGARFVDVQLRGPYGCWWHEHRFTADGDATIMEDRVYYRPPLGWLGRIANRLFVAGKLRSIFAYRATAIRHRFGPTAAASDRRAA